MNTPKKDYYTILEINRDASMDDIRKSYRKLAIKWHPDKNPDNRQLAEEKFKEISEAYGIMSDEEKNKSMINLVYAMEKLQILKVVFLILVKCLKAGFSFWKYVWKYVW